MKYKIFTLIYLISFALFSQTKGKVTYRIATVKDSIEQPYTNPEKTEIENDVLKMLHNSLPVEGYLVFNDSISIYKAEEEVDIPGYINITWFMAGGNSTYYSDLSREYRITQNALMGSTKRIKREPIEWTMTEETKEINGYLCYLATLDKRNNKKLKVWYAPDIPVAHGPKGYNGLPGLVLQIEDILYAWTVVNIDFDNAEADEIIEPVEGNLITQEEFKKFGGNIFKEN
jgi:GLPGLI family protein